jgi:hypothetical protein
LTAIPLTPVQQATTAGRDEPPYRAFIAGSLLLGIGGGFLLGTLIATARALEWEWGSGARYPSFVQAHGQLQLLGFVGLFIMAMVLRLAPRIAGRRIAFGWLSPWLLGFVSVSLVLRAVAEPAGDSVARDAALIASAALLLAGAAAFAAIIGGTNAGKGAQPSATSLFFVLGATAYAVGAFLNALQVYETVRDGLAAAPSSKQVPLVFVQQYGFALMFIGGVASRAVPTLAGRPRRDGVAVVSAVLLAAGVVLFVAAALWSAYRGGTERMARTEDAGLTLTAIAFVVLVFVSGALQPGPNRVAAASQTQLRFVRAAMAWLLAGAALTLWYAIPAFTDGRFVDQFEMDAIRHMLTSGLLTMLIMGMALMIVPEFAGRRLQHPGERWPIIGMLVALNVAVILRVWPASEGVDWIESTRFWPMAAAGGFAEGAVIVFALMFAQSYIEQRRPGWARPQELHAHRPDAAGK